MNAARSKSSVRQNTLSTRCNGEMCICWTLEDPENLRPKHMKKRTHTYTVRDVHTLYAAKGKTKEKRNWNSLKKDNESNIFYVFCECMVCYVFVIVHRCSHFNTKQIATISFLRWTVFLFIVFCAKFQHAFFQQAFVSCFVCIRK